MKHIVIAALLIVLSVAAASSPGLEQYLDVREALIRRPAIRRPRGQKNEGSVAARDLEHYYTYVGRRALFETILELRELYEDHEEFVARASKAVDAAKKAGSQIAGHARKGGTAIKNGAKAAKNAVVKAAKNPKVQAGAKIALKGAGMALTAANLARRFVREPEYDEADFYKRGDDFYTYEERDGDSNYLYFERDDTSGVDEMD